MAKRRAKKFQKSSDSYFWEWDFEILKSRKLSGVILVIFMESANLPAASENVNTMNLINNQELKDTVSEQKQTIEVSFPCISSHYINNVSFILVFNVRC